MADEPYTAYAQDDTYWTLRKRGKWFLVLRLNAGTYDEVERWGWYRKAGAAATAVDLLSYTKGIADGNVIIASALQDKLNELGLIVPKPDQGPKDEPAGAMEDDEDDD